MSQDRRNFLKTVGLGAAAAGTAGVVGNEAQAFFGKKTLKLSDVYEQFGKYICLLPGKFAGTVSAIDMSTGKTLGWIALWNYGNTIPIMHHLTCFPSEDPYKEFEFIVNTQGGKNLYIYGIPTTVKNPGEGFNIYKIRWDGTKMNLVSDIAEKTGMGLGVHVTSTPDATGFAIADGQKDIFAEFDRATETIRSAWFFDWIPNNTQLEKAWLDGGTLIIKRMKPTLPNGMYDYKGTKGIKLDWELVPGGELFAEQGKVPGPRVINTCALDAFPYDPRGKWGAVSIRLLGLAIIFDRDNWQPVAALLGPKGEPSQAPLTKIDDDTWKVEMSRVVTPAHQAGFSPDGNRFLFMNGVRQNNIMVWDTSNHADPTKWEKTAIVEDPNWRGSYPNTFHMVFTPDGKKCYVTLWWPSPTPNGIAVIDAVNWKLLKSVDLGPDMHTMGMTYDGKWVVGVISGYQKTTSAIAIMETETDEVIGFLPSAAGHHDSVIVPRTLEDLRISRCTTT